MNSSWTRNFISFLGSLLSAACLVLSFSPHSFHFLSFVALVPLLWVVKIQKKTRSIVAWAWLSSFLMTGIGYEWIRFTAQEFGHLDDSASWLVWGLFALVSYLCLPLSLGVYNKWSGLSSWLGRLTFPLIFATCEYWVPQVFPYRLAYSLGGFTYMRQFVDVAGPWGLSFAIVWINVLFFDLSVLLVILFSNTAYLKLGETSLSPSRDTSILYRRLLRIMGGLLVLFTGLFIYGVVRVDTVKQFRREHFLTAPQVTVVQANIGNFEKTNSEQGNGDMVHKVVGRFEELTQEAVNKFHSDIVIWPETAIPVIFPDAKMSKRISKLLNIVGVPLLWGGYWQQKDPENGLQKIYNNMFLQFPYTYQFAQQYQKQKLLAFGEYFPLADYFPWLRQLVPAISNFGAGKKFELMAWQGVSILPLICYEAILPSFLLQAKKLNFHLMVNVTNDSWYGGGKEALQHNEIAKFRAIEWRVPLIRATNTGISSIIDPYGNFNSSTPVNTEALMSARVYLSKAPFIWYQFWGDWPAWLGTLLLLGLVFISAKFKLKSL